MRFRSFVFLLAGTLAVSCGSNDSGSQSSSQEAAREAAPAEQAAVVPTGDTVNVVLNADDNMRYDKNLITVKEGQVVELVLNHTGTMPLTAMGHNFVLLKQDVNLEDFGNAAARADGPDHIPAEMASDVIVHTRMIGGGESDTIYFLTPAKGRYAFLCTFPGHFGVMKGRFVVE